MLQSLNGVNKEQERALRTCYEKIPLKLLELRHSHDEFNTAFIALLAKLKLDEHDWQNIVEAEPKQQYGFDLEEFNVEKRNGNQEEKHLNYVDFVGKLITSSAIRP